MKSLRMNSIIDCNLVKHQHEMINNKDCSGNTPLISAIHNKNLKVINTLLLLGADVNLPNNVSYY